MRATRLARRFNRRRLPTGIVHILAILLVPAAAGAAGAAAAAGEPLPAGPGAAAAAGEPLTAGRGAAAAAGAPLAAGPGATEVAGRPLTLEACLDLARRSSPALALERDRHAEAGAEADLAYAGFLPRVSASVSYSRYDEERLAPVGGGGAPALFAEESLATLRARQPLFDGLRSWAARAGAERGLRASDAGVIAAEAELELAVTVAFVRLLTSRDLLEVARRSLERQQGFEALVSGLRAEGRGSRLDELRAKAQRLEAERLLVAAREARELSEAQLERVLGVELPGPVEPDGALAAEPLPPGEEDALLAAARERSPDLLRLGFLVEQAEQAARVSRAGYFPELSLQGSYGLRRRDVGGEADEWAAGVFLDWSLFEGGATVAAVDRSEARVRQVGDSRRALERGLAADVREALAAWRTSVAAVESTRAALEAQREAREVAAALYQLGRATALDVLTAQAELSRGEASLILALADHALARARMARLGGGRPAAASGIAAVP